MNIYGSIVVLSKRSREGLCENMNLKKNIYNLIHNMKVLFNIRIEDVYWNNMEYIKTAILYGRLLMPQKSEQLKILNSKDTLELLLKSPKSFYRFGDGEILLMTGGAAGTQKNDLVLSGKLYQALTDTSVDAYIGIGYDYFDFDLWGKSEYSNCFYLIGAEKYRRFYIENCEKDYTYIDTGFSQRYFLMEIEESERWFKRLKLLFKGYSMTLFMGEQAYNNLNYYIFDEAKEIKVEFCPSRNAFEQYDELMERARRLPKTELICLAVGATAKVMAYELTKEGYLVFDIGHLPKDYDSYMKKISRNKRNAEKFYLEDYRLK